MIIDILFVVVVIIAIFKGLRKGFVIGLFSLLSFLIGIAAAIKLSAFVSHQLSGTIHKSEKWLPLISFLLVFIVVILAVGFGARLIKKIIDLAMLGWLDRLAGAVLYLAIYILIFSVLLFYCEKLALIRPETIAASHSYNFVQPFGPKVINSLGKIIPFFKDMFADLEKFFSGFTK
ncbi:MAG: CvpA family protein [Bacteroidota bacterium]|nr:CvpA family protein [Bacteroidota bacterium]